MKTINDTTLFTDAQKRPRIKKTISFELYRRYWDGSAYVLETTQVVDLDDWVIKDSIGDILWTMDTVQLNEFKLGNVEFEVNNKLNEWAEDTSAGIWDGFEAFLSVVKIKMGLYDINNAEQVTYTYNGVIAKDGIKIIDPIGRRAKIKVLGLSEILRNKNAEAVSQSTASLEITSCDLSSATTIGKTGLTMTPNEHQYKMVRVKTGTGKTQVRSILSNTATTFTVNAWTTEPNDSPTIEVFGEIPADSPVAAPPNQEFVTTNTGVGIIKGVYVNDTLRLPGSGATEYTITNLNIKGTKATITFNTALDDGDNIVFEYLYWYVDKTFKWLVEQLLTEAGITNHSVEDAIFDNNIVNNVDDTSKSDWDAYVTKVQIETSPESYEDFSEGSMGIDLQAEAKLESDESVTVLYHRSDTKGWFQTFKHSDDFWVSKIGFYVRRVGSLAGEVTFGLRYSLYGVDLFTQSYTINDIPTSYTWLEFTLPTPLRLEQQQLYALFMSQTGGGILNHVQWKYWINNPYANGLVYDDSTTPYTKHPNEDFNFRVYGYKYYSDGYAFSDTVDGTASLTAWGVISSSISVPSGTTLKIYTRTQDADSGWPTTWTASEWVEIDETTGQILSDLKRYLKIAIRMTSTQLNYTSYINSLNLKFYTDEFLISLANFTGLSVWGAISDLASKPDYEFGFKTEETESEFYPLFFFRSKDVNGEADISITADDNLVKVKEYEKGIKYVYNRIETTFGDYTHREDSLTILDDEPHSQNKYSFRRLSISGGQLTSNAEVNIAKGICLRFLDHYKEPKRRCKAISKYLIQVDIGDKIELTQKQPTLDQTNFYGAWDDGGEWDDGGYWDEEQEWFLYEVAFKVIGVRIKYRTGEVELILKER